MGSNPNRWEDLIPREIKSIPKLISRVRKRLSTLKTSERIPLASSFVLCESEFYSKESIVCSYFLIGEGFCSDDGFMDFLENLAFAFGTDFEEVSRSPDLILDRLSEPTELLAENSIFFDLFSDNDLSQLPSASSVPAPFSCVTKENCTRYAPRLCEIFLDELADTLALQ